MTMPSSNEVSPYARAPVKNMATRASSYRVRKRALLTWPYTSLSDQRTATSWTHLTGFPSVFRRGSAQSRGFLRFPPRVGSVTGQLAIGDPVRPGRLGAEPVDLVLLVRLVGALEPEPLVRILVGALPGQHVGGDAVEE